MTRIFRPTARSATMEPILPQPIRPRVLPVSSTPMKRFFSHLPALVEADASGIWRASANIMAMACSAVVMVLPCGVFITTTPRAVAERMSTLSTPMPARPTTLRLVATSSSSRVTLVAERTASPSYGPMMTRRSAGDRPGFKSTSIPRRRKMSTAAGESLSLIKTLGMDHSLVWAPPATGGEYLTTQYSSAPCGRWGNEALLILPPLPSRTPPPRRRAPNRGTATTPRCPWFPPSHPPRYATLVVHRDMPRCRRQRLPSPTLPPAASPPRPDDPPATPRTKVPPALDRSTCRTVSAHSRPGNRPNRSAPPNARSRPNSLPTVRSVHRAHQPHPPSAIRRAHPQRT